MKGGANRTTQLLMPTRANRSRLNSRCFFVLAVYMSWSTIVAGNQAMSKTAHFQFMNARVKTGWRLTHALLLHTSGSTSTSCWWDCQDHPQCVSFNLRKDDTCQLSASDIYLGKDALEEDKNSQHFYMPVSSTKK